MDPGLLRLFVVPVEVTILQLLLSGGIAVFRSHFLMTNSVIIRGRDFIALIDPAYYPDEVEVLGEVVARSNKPETYCLYTHFDYDHVVDPRNLQAYRVASQAVLERDLEGEVRLWQEMDQRLYVEREDYTMPEPDYLVAGRRETIDLGEEELVAVPLPGHTADGLVFIFPARRVAVVGDMLSDKEFPFVNDSLTAYRQSLLTLRRLVEKYQIDLVIPGHGNVAQGSEIEQRIEADLQYLAALSTAAQVSAGRSETEIAVLCGEIRYKNRPIPSWQQEEHRNNLLRAICEHNTEK